MPDNFGTLRPLTFRVNRPLSRQERLDHLPQDRASPSKPWSQLSVIRMNSTYLECVDLMHSARGGAVAGFIVLAPLVFGLLFTLFGFWQSTLSAPETELVVVIVDLLLSILWILFAALNAFLIKADCFNYTHYPTRFNRKTRMVHVFRPGGKVVSVPWDEVYFTLLSFGAGHWYTVGHVLSEDRKTVLETFPLSTRTFRSNESPVVYQHWEFVRRYMEEGPEKLMDQVSMVFPIDTKREGFWLGTSRMFANFIHWPIFMVIFAPALLLGSIGRWIALRTCKIPQWPAEIVAESQIDPDDPYIRDEHHLAEKPGIWMFGQLKID
jgi:hypothetical protein